MANSHHISKYQARKLIKLCGSRSVGYLVLSGGRMLPISTPDYRTGIAIVRALRELAEKAPADYFPRGTGKC